MERIRLRPRFDLRKYLGEICLVSAEHKRLREQDQVLMAIQLPNDFVIACARRVEIGNAPEIIEAGFAAAHVIAPPVDRGSRVDRQAKKRKAMRANLGSRAMNLVSKVRRA